MNDIERILIIRPYEQAKISHKRDVLEKYKITEKELSNYIESGTALKYDNKTVYFDTPIPVAYE